MVDIETPQSIITLLDAIRIQVDVITTLSSGGLGIIIYTWARILGIFDDANLKNFRKPVFLAFPAIAFLFSIALGYLIGPLTTGYFTEVAKGRSASGAVISSAREHYFSDYYDCFNWVMASQVGTSFGGIVLLSIWYVCNVIKRERKNT